MNTTMKTAFTVGLLAMLMALPAFGGSINKSVKIAAGVEAAGASSVNGSVSVGSDAVVTGGVNTVNGTVKVDSGASIQDASTVNGGLKIGANVKADNLSTVNGAIRVGESATIRGEIEAVNGQISIAKGTTVAKDVGNVNGHIELSGAQVGGDVSTVNGDIEIIGLSVVKGDVIVEKPGGWNWSNSMNRKPRVVIGPGATVEGMIALQREVDLFISETAKVGGVSGIMSMNDAVRFSGENP